MGLLSDRGHLGALRIVFAAREVSRLGSSSGYFCDPARHLFFYSAQLRGAEIQSQPGTALFRAARSAPIVSQRLSAGGINLSDRKQTRLRWPTR